MAVLRFHMAGAALCVYVWMCVYVCVAAEARSYLSLMVAAEHAAPLLLRLLLSPLSLLA